MSEYPDWLPPLTKIFDYGGNVTRYYDALYENYCQDLVYNPPSFESIKVQTLAQPMKDGKEAGFWHILEGGKKDDLPEQMWRHERVCWIKPIIIASCTDRVCLWKVPWGRGLLRPHIALLDFSYMVVLEQHKKSVKIITAFPIERQPWRDKKKREWEKLRTH